MSDPIDKLTRLGDALEGAPMPLPASAIRARGDRIRRRKHAVLAGASAAVVAAVAVPLIVLGGGDSAKEIPPADPSVSDPAQSGAIGEANLLTSKEAVYPTGGTVDWRERMTIEGDGQAAYSPCTETSMDGLGAETVWQRDFSFVVTETNEVESTNHLNEIIAEFPSTTEAEAAYDEIKGWYDDCLPSGADRFDAGTFAPVPIDVAGTAEAQLSTYGPVDEETDPFGDLSYFLETGLVLSGNRLAVLSQTIVGQDYNFDIDRRPVVQMLPAAAERLVLGVGSQVDPTDPPAAEGLVTEIPDGFPLTDGWPSDDGSDEYQLDPPSIDNESMVDGGDLDGCGQSVEALEPADRLTTRLDLGSAYYARELQLFSDEAEAERYFDSIEDSFSVCEAEGGAGYTVEQSGDSVALLWAEGIDRTVAIAVLDRNAVLVGIESGDEGVNDADTVGRMWVGVAEGLGGVREELQDLLDGVPGTSPGGVDTTIPDDFPLDVNLDDPGDDGELHPPYRPAASEQGVDVDLCGNVVWPPSRDGEPAYADLLRARATGPEWGDYRELTTYESVDAAVAAVADIRSALDGCERDGSWVWTVSDVDTGYDSVTFHRTYTQGLGRDTFQVTRVGTAVLFTVSTGEGSIADLGPATQERTRLTRAIAPSMCLFTEDGCL